MSLPKSMIKKGKIYVIDCTKYFIISPLPSHVFFLYDRVLVQFVEFSGVQVLAEI